MLRDDVGTTRVTLRWPFFSVVVAAVWVSPWTLGTITLPCPPDTVSVIVEPLSAFVRPCGDVLITIPRGLPLWTWTSDVAKPALVRIASAMLTCWPTTYGTTSCLGRLRKYAAAAAPATSSSTRTASNHGSHLRRPGSGSAVPGS